MSAGKKKSGFQITSVTSDYGQGSGEPAPVQRVPFSTESGVPSSQSVPSGREGTDVLHGVPQSRAGTDRGVGFDSAGDFKPASRAGSIGGDEMGSPKVPNGPSMLDVIRRTHMSSSQPSTPAAARRHIVAQDLGPGGLSPQASRFRVVRLGQGLGEPYRRGRWTCVDYMEREGGEERGLRRVMDSMRHAHSLESLETVGLGGTEGGREGGLLKPLGHVGNLRSAHLVHSQGTTHMRAPRLTAEGREHGDIQAWHPSATGRTSFSGPSSPSHKERFSVTPVDASSPRTSLSSPPAHLLEPQPLSPPRYLSESGRPRLTPPPLRLDMDASGRPLFRETLSQPSSPGPPSSRSGSSRQSVNPVPTPSALSLAQSMFGVGGAFDLNDESGSGNSMIAIDNKIEQAMDLVKTHLMMAVREEVEVLREQIKELAERNAQLERENYILRALRERD